MKKRTAELEAQNAELDAFAHTVAHDLKNPIGIIIGYSEILSEEQEKLESQTELSRVCLQYILQTGIKLERIVESLMLLTGVRKQVITPEPLDMVKIVEDTLTRFQFLIQNTQARIIILDQSQWPTALGYAPWIEEVWANYISNALKYGGKPPVITLGGELIAPVEAGQPPMARFWVHDNGVGISEEKQKQLFTPFTRLEQARTQGHGLGLSIVRRIIEKLGGTVGVESALGQGSTFYFTLPLTPSQSDQPPIPPSEASEAPLPCS